jgi:hypothetical protein
MLDRAKSEEGERPLVSGLKRWGVDASPLLGHTIEISSHPVEEVSPPFSRLNGDRDRGFGS